MIRKFFMAGVALAAISGSALAADLPSRMAPPVYTPQLPIWTWTGFYVGINGGYAGNQVSQDLNYGGIPYYQFKATASGFVGGGQIGYNWQFPTSPFVLGVEADFQGSSLKGSYLDETYYCSYNYSLATKVNWLGTLRARLGYSFGQIMPYVTGGLAYGKVTDSGDYYYYDAGGNSKTMTGWTVGAGLEYAITHNLTFKTEYLYTDLGKMSYTPYYTDEEPYGLATKVSFHTIRAGLNYKFDWAAPAAPIVAKY